MRHHADGRVASAVTEQPRALARRYAKALLELARAEGPAAAGKLQAELSGFAQLLTGNAALSRALLRPLLGGAARRRVLGALAERLGASPLLGRLLELLAVHDRVGLLPPIAEAFAEARNREEGRVTAEAVTATPLAEAQASALASALGAALGKTVELRTRVEPAVLGGVLVRMAGRSYDGTVRAQLAALRARLSAGS